MAGKITTIRFTEGDRAAVDALRSETGVCSVTEVVRYALRRAQGQDPEPEPDSDSDSDVEALHEALRLHRLALAMWTPASFEEARAKAAAEEAFERL